MSENNNEQMDLGNGAMSNNDKNDASDAAKPTNGAQPDVTATISQLNIAIKTPKEKRDITIEQSSTVKQVK